MKIFLTGFPGSGKSTLGKAAAESLDIPFFDTDEMVEEAEGKTISEIFAAYGEEIFRQKEASVLRTLASKRNAIVATGGGLPCSHQNMEWMNDHGITIYLEASAAFLFHRLMKEKKHRPLIASLSDIELMIYITETLSSRNSFYTQSKLKVDAETCSKEKFISLIRKKAGV